MGNPSVVGLVDGALGDKVEPWLQDREDITLQATFSVEERLTEIPEVDPDLIISVGYKHMIPTEIIDIPDRGIVNLHYSYLPYARGANPNVWSIVDDHPAGVSIHYVTERVDAGPIIARRTVPIYPDDTGRDLYTRLIDKQFELFIHHWDEIRDGTATTQPNNVEDGTFHRSAAFDSLCELDTDESMTIGETIDILRALTFPPHNNAYFVEDGNKYYVEINITPAESE